jgi:hypothetical protein
VTTHMNHRPTSVRLTVRTSVLEPVKTRPEKVGGSYCLACVATVRTSVAMGWIAVRAGRKRMVRSAPGNAGVYISK